MVIYSCKVCKITTIIKCQYIRHLNTNKHKFNILEVKVSPLEEKSKSKVSIIESIILQPPNAVKCETSPRFSIQENG